MVIMPSDVLSGSSPLFSFYAALRSQEPMVLQEEGGVTLSGSSLLFLGGGGGAHTPFHVDWTEALNVGMGVEGVTSVNAPIAT